MFRRTALAAAVFAAATLFIVSNIYSLKARARIMPGSDPIQNRSSETPIRHEEAIARILLPLIVRGDKNDLAPEATDDHYQATEDTRLVLNTARGVLKNDRDPDMCPLEAILVDDVSNGILDLRADGSFDYTAGPGYLGEDSFRYRASDGKHQSNLATVELNVSKHSDNRAPTIVSGEIAFSKSVIGSGMNETHSVKAADLNGDRYLDVVATNTLDGRVHWYENNGINNFEDHVLDADLEGAYPSHVADVDGDGDIDVLAAGYYADVFAWYQNDGRGNFTRKDIDSAIDGPHSIVTGDLDQDGDIDLVTSIQDANTIAWYENDGKLNFSRHVIYPWARWAKRAEIADINGDGTLDVLAASFHKDEIAWLENDGSENFTRHIISSQADGAYYVSAADIDGDGDVDALSASQYDHTIGWYRNDGAGNFEIMTIDNNAKQARTVIPADIDNDGDPDALTASVNDNTIGWYKNDGKGNFTKLAVDNTVGGAYGVFAIDMDFDNDLDVLSSSRDDNQVLLHTQIRTHEVAVIRGETLEINSTVLLSKDVDNGPAELIYALIDAPDFGEVHVDDKPIAPNGTFTQEDVNNGRVTYVHKGDSNKAVDGFSFTVSDGGENYAGPAGGNFVIRIEGKLSIASGSSDG